MSISLHYLKSKPFHNKAEQKEVKNQRKALRKELKESKVDPNFLKEIPLFVGLEEVTYHKIAKRMQHTHFARQAMIYQAEAMQEEFSPIYVILEGDIAVYLKSTSSDEVNKTVSNYLSAGEVYVQKLHHKENYDFIEIVALSPVRILTFTYQELNYLLSKSSTFRSTFAEMIRTVTQRQASRFDNDFQKEIAQFFVEERLTFSQRVKIKRMDICIECDGCYTACKDRHGTDRLGASEVKYGITEVPNNCHNCVVPECLDKCNYGTITLHEESGEIVISDNCFGCGACSQGCSFNAIQMHPVDTLNLEHYFPNRDPNAKGKQIAQKCDNCVGYEDQACISACPTGALFQVDGEDLFHYWEQFNVHENPGFDNVISPQDHANRARPWWIAFTLLNFVFLSYECLMRVWYPQLAFGHLFYEWGLKGEDLIHDKAMRSGQEFGHALGYLASLFMLVTQLYTPARKLAPLLGSVQMWFEIHVWFGFLGFIYGFYHTAFNWREPIAVTSFTLFSIVILTGVLGRYLIFHIPRSQAGKNLAFEEVNQQLQNLNQEVEQLFKNRKVAYDLLSNVLKQSQLQKQALEDKQEQKKKERSRENQDSTNEDESSHWWTSSSFYVLFELRRELKKINQSVKNLAQEVQSEMRDDQIDHVIALIQKKARLIYMAESTKKLSKLLKYYRGFHVSISHLTFAVLTLHILHALKWIGF
jgi:Fe-S-cluster-containing hydrogenase component 2